jgi:hypothetical protein
MTANTTIREPSDTCATLAEKDPSASGTNMCSTRFGVEEVVERWLTAARSNGPRRPGTP